MVATALERPTLVLNRNWQPVSVSTVARSLVKVFAESARIVDPHDYRTYDWADWSELEPRDGDAFVRTQTLRIRVPEVVTLVAYDRVPVNAVAFSRRNLFKRDGHECQYCGAHPGSEELTIDHVLPRSRGGNTSWENCVLACVSCNHRKANRTPREAGLHLRTDPKRPRWTPLFAARGHRIDSWQKFLSEAYWNVELDD